MAKALDMPSLYDTDYVAWLSEQAAIETSVTEKTFPPILPYSVEQVFERELPAEELPERRKKQP